MEERPPAETSQPQQGAREHEEFDIRSWRSLQTEVLYMKPPVRFGSVRFRVRPVPVPPVPVPIPVLPVPVLPVPVKQQNQKKRKNVDFRFQIIFK